MTPLIPKAWLEQLEAFFATSKFKHLHDFVETAYEKEVVYPPKPLVYQALELTPYNDVKVVILGQDPYHGPNQANGLAFSVQPDVVLPPSLRNIYQELTSDLGISPPVNGDLSCWAKQGVLLLNTVLTVRAGEANSHRGHGWEALTDYVIDCLNQHPERLVFILWGKPAQSKLGRIDTNRHAVIQSSHPSPLSAYRSFFGSKPFSRTNEFLREWGRDEIEWGEGGKECR